MIVGIDASRNKSWGAIAHILGLVGQFDRRRSKIEILHIWAHETLANLIPEKEGVVVHSPKVLGRNIIFRLLWQRFVLPRLLLQEKCDVLFASDAGSICRYRPYVVLCQDLLPFDISQLKKISVSYSLLRALVLRIVHQRTIETADGVIFLTDHAREVCENAGIVAKNCSVIPHGVDDYFRQKFHRKTLPQKVKTGSVVELVYVSNVDSYKNQWSVVEAVHQLRLEGFNLLLNLVGGDSCPPNSKLKGAIQHFDPNGEFVRKLGHLSTVKLRKVLAKSDIFVFASSCENLPITMLEGMAMGLPIASSAIRPMTDILEDGALFFNPDFPDDIASTIRFYLSEPHSASERAYRSHRLSSNYTWKQCANKTFDALSNCVERSGK